MFWLKAITVALVVCEATRASAGGIESSLAKLEPEERSHQACILKGLREVARDPKLRRADRMKTSIFTPATLKGTLTAQGAAVRVKGHWYRLVFECKLTQDYMKATTFTFELGAEIPRAEWDRLGLWG
jgi:hypothetical protein